MSKAKPFLKWAGGKSRLAKEITSFFPLNFNKYYEPFLGGGAIYFAISPREGILNDLNKYLIGTYEIIRDRPNDLIKKLKKIDKKYHSLLTIDQKSKYYYDLRNRYNEINKITLDKAAIFIFLNKTGFNGMYRENSKGKYNIPFGKHEKSLICDENNILEVSRNLQQIKFTTGDYKEAIKSAGRGDLVYLDPPYIPVSKTAKFTQYQKEGFNYNHQIELKNLALDLHNKGCFVVISNSYCEESKELYKDEVFTINVVNVVRLIHSSKKVVREIVVTNF